MDFILKPIIRLFRKIYKVTKAVFSLKIYFINIRRENDGWRN